ncbi:hypothetical protein ACVIGA_003121 [Bradyrhizobium sp. USDA 3240]
MPVLEIIKSDIVSLGSDIHVDTSTPDFFFFRGVERQIPFATVVTRDTEFDNLSRLDSDGAFRLNIAPGRDAFRALFPDHASRAALETAHFDYAARDELQPHPVYGRMHWVCAVNPENSYSECRVLLRKAYELARR